jgi:hypothetical protein
MTSQFSHEISAQTAPSVFQLIPKNEICMQALVAKTLVIIKLLGCYELSR